MSSQLIVQKYGGSSLATPKHIRRAAAQVHSLFQQGQSVIVVVSAMGYTTDHLIRLAKRTVESPPRRELDMLLTAGERISMSLLAMALHDLGTPAISFTGSQSGILTNNEHTRAQIVDVKAIRIREALDRGRVAIVAGFQGVSAEKEITTLGRGGSDTTAVALAAAFGAERCDILTDVPGLFTADPRLVPSANRITHCSYDSAIALASLGAKMHCRAMELAKKFKVRVRIAPSGSPDLPGTWIDVGNQKMEGMIVRGIATQDGYSYLAIASSLPQLVPLLKDLRITARFFQANRDITNLALPSGQCDALSSSLHEAGISFEITQKVALVSVVGDGFSESTELLPRIFARLQMADFEPLLSTASPFSVTVVVGASQKAAATRLLHEEFLEGIQDPPHPKDMPQTVLNS